MEVNEKIIARCNCWKGNLRSLLAAPLEWCCFLPHGALRRDIGRALRYPNDQHARPSTSRAPTTNRSTSARSWPSSQSLPTTMPGSEQELRRAVAQRLKAVLTAGRGHAEQLLLKDRHGRRCAERLCFMHGRDHPRPVRVRHRASLSIGKSVRGRAHGDRGDRRLRPRPAGAGLRHRSAVPAALQADGVGRVGRRGDPLLPVGSRTEGRPRHALDRRMHPPGQGGHDDPHRDPGSRASCSATRSCSTN